MHRCSSSAIVQSMNYTCERTSAETEYNSQYERSWFCEARLSRWEITPEFPHFLSTVKVNIAHVEVASSILFGSSLPDIFCHFSLHTGMIERIALLWYINHRNRNWMMSHCIRHRHNTWRLPSTRGFKLHGPNFTPITNDFPFFEWAENVLVCWRTDFIPPYFMCTFFKERVKRRVCVFQKQEERMRIQKKISSDSSSALESAYIVSWEFCRMKYALVVWWTLKWRRHVCVCVCSVVV